MLALCLSAPAGAITFSNFVAGGDLSATLSNTSTIGFAYAGDKFVGSVYFGANNNQLYSTDLNGGSVQKFGSPIAGFSGEIYVGSSLGIGGWGPRDVYAGSEALGQVTTISHDGSAQGVFASGLVGGVRSIAFDPFGLYGFDMLVATNAGRIYRINSSGTPTQLASVGEDAEGLSFAPQGFGPFAAGTLFVASEGSGSIRAITPAGTVTTAVSGIGGAEMLSFVPLNLGSSGNPVEGFYAASFPSNIVRAPASDFAPFIGDAIVTTEFSHRVVQIHWNGSAFVTTDLGAFPNQPEDGIFVTADIIRPPVPEPASVGLLLAGLVWLPLARRLRRPS
jgi:hypothetical protein